MALFEVVGDDNDSGLQRFPAQLAAERTFTIVEIFFIKVYLFLSLRKVGNLHLKFLSILFK